MRFKLGIVVVLVVAFLFAVLSYGPSPTLQRGPHVILGPRPPGVSVPVGLGHRPLKDVSAPIVGELLTSTNGTWSNSPTSFTYVWLQCASDGTGCTAISGATTNSYTISSGDLGHTIASRVTAINGSGSAEQQSNLSGVVTSGGGSLLFDGTFETPVSSGASAPWATWQCANYSGQLGTNHYFGDTYFDNGGSVPTLSRQVNTTFHAASSAAVPPFAGSYSARIVLPTTPKNQGWSRSDCGMLQATKTQDASAAGIGHTVYYGLALYVPAGESLSPATFDGNTMQEIHTNFLSAGPVTTALHTGPTSEFNNTGNAVDLTVETGPCSGVHKCSYHSNAFDPNRCTGNGSSPPSPSSPNCNVPPIFAIPPGKLAYGSWNRYVLAINWETSATGSIQAWYKNANTAGAWVDANAATDGGVAFSGFPTMQWSGTTGTSPPTGLSSYNDAMYSYTAALNAPFQISYDNEVWGTTLSIVEAQLP